MAVFLRRLIIINSEITSKNDNSYDICLTCEYIGKTCDGPNFLSMSSERWSEWLRMRKDIIGITNMQLADKSGIPKGTIDRILSGHGKDVRFSTMRAITKPLIGGTWGHYPCHSAKILRQEMTKKTAHEVNRMREYVRTSKDDHTREINQLIKQNEDAKNTIKLKEKRITALTIALITLTVLVIAVLLYDVLNPQIGFVRY